MLELWVPVGQVQTGHVQLRARGNIELTVADAQGVLRVATQVIEGFLNKVGGGLERTIITTQSDIKGQLVLSEEILESGSVIVGDDGGFETTNLNLAVEITESVIEFNVIRGAQFGFQQNVICAVSIRLREAGDVIHDSSLGRCSYCRTERVPVNHRFGDCPIHVEDHSLKVCRHY